MGDDMKRWYVVRHPQCPIAIDDFNARVWTLSLDPYLPGWNTPDIEGCGLPRALADELAHAANLVHMAGTRGATRGLPKWVPEIDAYVGRGTVMQDIDDGA